MQSYRSLISSVSEDKSVNKADAIVNGICEAAIKKDREALKKILSTVSINYCNSDGDCAVAKLAFQGKVEAVTFLIKEFQASPYQAIYGYTIGKHKDAASKLLRSSTNNLQKYSFAMHQVGAYAFKGDFKKVEKRIEDAKKLFPPDYRIIERNLRLHAGHNAFLGKHDQQGEEQFSLVKKLVADKKEHRNQKKKANENRLSIGSLIETPVETRGEVLLEIQHKKLGAYFHTGQDNKAMVMLAGLSQEERINLLCLHGHTLGSRGVPFSDILEKQLKEHTKDNGLTNEGFQLLRGAIEGYAYKGNDNAMNVVFDSKLYAQLSPKQKHLISWFMSFQLAAGGHTELVQNMLRKMHDSSSCFPKVLSYIQSYSAENYEIIKSVVDGYLSIQSVSCVHHTVKDALPYLNFVQKDDLLKRVISSHLTYGLLDAVKDLLLIAAPSIFGGIKNRVLCEKSLRDSLLKYIDADLKEFHFLSYASSLAEVRAGFSSAGQSGLTAAIYRQFKAPAVNHPEQSSVGVNSNSKKNC